MINSGVLAINQLKVRPEYQRTLNDKRVLRMAAKFDPILVGNLEVAYDGTDYWVIDGQHRLAAMQLAGITAVDARVHEHLTLAQEADLFARLNTERKAVTPNDLFKAELVAGIPRAVEIEQTLRTYELSVGHHSRTSVQAVAVLFALQKTGVLDSVLRLVTEVWTDAEGVPVQDAMDGRVLRSIGRFLVSAGRQQGFSMSRLRAALLRHRPDELIREVRAYSSFEFGGKTVLTRWYNYRLAPQHRLPE